MRVLLSIAVAWAGGVLAESSARGGPLVWCSLAAGAALATVAAAALRRARVATALAVAVALVGGGLASALVRARAAIGPMLPGEGERVLEGVVARPVETSAFGRWAIVDVDGVIAPDAAGGRRGASARVRVAWAGDGGADLLPGDRVRFAADPRAPRGYWNEGAVDRERLLAGRGVDLVATARAPGPVRVDAPARLGVFRPAAWLRARLDAAASDATMGEGGALVRALVLGRREALAPSLEEAFRRLGVSHVLSVSGLHLAAVAFLLFAAARAAWLRTRWAARVEAERVAAAVALPGAIAYTLVTGAEVATVRSLIAAIVVLGGAALGRRTDALTALAAAALVILADAPWALFEPSFQLSFAATAALATLAARWSRVVPAGRGPLARAGAWAARLAIASAAATLATTPFSALHFGVMQPAGLVANLVIVPIAELVVLPLGLAGAVVGAVWRAAGAPLLALAGLCAEALAALVRAGARVAPVVELPPPRPLELAALGVALVALAALRPARRAVLVAAIAAAAAAVSCALPRPRAALVVTFLDVGQGDAAVIETPGDETWLVDAGGRLFGAPDPEADPDERLRAAATDPGEQAVARFLRARRIRRLDVVMVSHPHPDHFGGLGAVAARVPIGEVWIAGDEIDDPRWWALLAELEARGARVVRPPAGTARGSGDVTLSVLAPLDDAGARAEARADRHVNDNSLVARVDFAGRSILFTGDLEGEGEAALVASGADLRVDVVKAPHHGSRTSSSPALVAATRPGWVVVSCGARNRFRFPAPEVVARWEAAGARVLRTDLSGAITVRVAPDGQISISTHK